MEVKKLRVVFIGCGNHATENIYPSIRYCPMKLLATCAKHIENSKINAKLFGAPNYYDDYKKMLDIEKPDAAIIVVNSRLHSEMVQEVLKRGIHVFVEKPPAMDLKSTEKIINESEQNNKIVMVGFQKRYAPACVKAKKLMQSKGFGPPGLIQTKLCTGKLMSETDYLIEVGIHHLDLVRFFFGEVSSLFVNESTGNGRVTYAINLKFENGAVGSMALSEQQSWFYHNERIEITGAGNCIEIDNICKLTYFDNGLEICGIPVSQLLRGSKGKIVWEPNFTCMNTENSILYLSGIISELRHFCECVFNQEKPQTSIEDAYKTMLLVTKIKEHLGLKSNSN